MRKAASLLTVLMLFCVLAFAQTRTVSGTVRDAQGNPIPFATVTEAGTKNAVQADASGNYTIKVADNAQLTVSATGYSSSTIASGTASAIVLARTEGQLQEVVVTALGQTRQAKELGYSTAKVKAAELTQAKPVNLQNGLTGKVSGLNVQTVNNSVFEDTRLTLRGIRSLTGNNQPMLIVDGVPMNLKFLNSLNPNDVQDVTILKSATATAVYGPEGVNGAMVITTKKGSRGRPTISVSHTTQLAKVSFMPKFQEGFGSGSAVDANQQGVYDPIENQGYGDAFDGTMRPIGRPFDRNGDGDITDHDDTLFTTYSAKPDEKKKFWETGITNQTDVSFSTGDFYLSAQNVNVKGVMPKDENNRVSLRMSAMKEYNRFKATFNTNYTQQNYDINAGSQFGNGRDYTPYWNLINTPMQIPITDFKDWRNDFWSNPNHYYNDYYYNPYWLVDMFREQGRSDEVFGNLDLNLKATSWLTLNYRLGGTISNSTYKQFQYPFTYSPESKASNKSTAQSGDIAAGVRDGSSFSYRLNQEFFVTAGKQFNKIRVDGLLGHNFREEFTKNINVSNLNLGIPGLFNISARKGELNGSEGLSKTRLQRFFGRANFAYNNWAFAELAGSYDFDSKLANPYNYDVNVINFLYSSASLSFVLTEAVQALKNSNTLSYMKVRASVGKTGNTSALGAYSLENRFLPGPNFPYGNTLGYSASDVLFQNSYEPEIVKTVEAGIELGFLKNRINFEATAYKQDNSNQLITVNYSAATGYPQSLLNAAAFTNKGVELDLRLTPLVKFNNVNIDFKVNYTYQTNEVTKLLEGVEELGIGNGNYVIVGKPAYTFKLTDYKKDSLGRVIVDKNTGFPTVDPNLKAFGRTLPTHLLGLNLSVNFKALTFSAVADYRTGNQIYSGIGPDMDFSGISYRTGQNGRMPFIFPNSVYNTNSDPNAKPTYVANTNVYTPGGYSFWSTAVNTSANSNYLASAAFWKLREVSLTYAMPTKWFGFTRGAVKGASLTLSGRNLAMWLPKTNEWTDPEFSNTTGNAQGVNDRNNNPPTRIFGANLTVNF